MDPGGVFVCCRMYLRQRQQQGAHQGEAAVVEPGGEVDEVSEGVGGEGEDEVDPVPEEHLRTHGDVMWGVVACYRWEERCGLKASARSPPRAGWRWLLLRCLLLLQRRRRRWRRRPRSFVLRGRRAWPRAWGLDTYIHTYMYMQRARVRRALRRSRERDETNHQPPKNRTHR